MTSDLVAPANSQQVPRRRGPRVAIAGVGMIGALHHRAALQAGAEVIGVVASTPQRSREAAQRWNTAIGYPDFSVLVSDPQVDVVHICTPNTDHVGMAEAALRAGKHVVCEKPLATSPPEAARLVKLAADSGLTATVPFVYRFHPLVREIRARRLAGEFGPWQLIHGSYLQDWLLSEQAGNWRVDPSRGGPSRAFADIGSHWFDLVEWVSGEEFTEVMAATSITVPFRPTGGDPAAGTAQVTTEDIATVLMRSRTGVLGTMAASQVSAGRKNRLWFELDGARASAVFDQELPETAWIGRTSGAEIIVRDPGSGSADARRLSSLPAGHPQGYAQCFDAFVSDTYAAIAGEDRPGLPTFSDGLRSTHLVDAVLTSAQTKTWIEVSA